MRPGPTTIVAIRKTTARPLGAQGRRTPARFSEPERGVERENDERRHAEEIAGESLRARHRPMKPPPS